MYALFKTIVQWHGVFLINSYIGLVAKWVGFIDKIHIGPILKHAACVCKVHACISIKWPYKPYILI